MLELILKLLLAHLIGDFLFQPKNWTEDKERYRHKSKYLYWHMLIHLLVLVFLLEFDKVYWMAVPITIISHYLIDLTKSFLYKKINQRILFGVDQLMHLLVMIWIVHYYYVITSIGFSYSSEVVMLYIVFILLNTTVSSIVMKVVFTKWNYNNELNEGSLAMAGTYIGMLERLLVFVFIITNHWSSIGFLIAAKSIFRFGDLSKSKDRKLTEYVLIGTLISFGLAILYGLIFQYIRSAI